MIAGGWIGVLFPTIAFASPAEAVFPHSLLNNTYFYAHVHLQFAEVQHFLGFQEGRPQTFFAYTNAWGSTCAMLTPVVPGRARGEPRPGVGARAQDHACGSRSSRSCSRSNRGLWLSLGVGLAYAAVRFGALRDMRRVMRVLGAVSWSGCWSPSRRWAGSSPPASAIRPATRAGSPATRPRRRRSSRARCSATAPRSRRSASRTRSKSVGTESEIFLLLYSHGVPALFLFGAFMAYTIVRTAKQRSRSSPALFWIHVALLVACVQAPYYELTERMPLMLAFAALLYRDIAVQSDLRFAERTRGRLRAWTRRAPAPVALDVD